MKALTEKKNFLNSMGYRIKKPYLARVNPVDGELGLGELWNATVAWDGEGHATGKNAIHDSKDFIN